MASKHNIPLSLLARYAKEHGWVEKRKRYNALPDRPSIDVSKLARSSDALETIIESAFISVSESALNNKELDTKTLKELTSTLKEAINIKQNIYLLPMVTEQKHLEYEQRKNPDLPSSENEIRVILDDDTEKYSV